MNVTRLDRRLHCVQTGFPRSNPDCLFDIQDENFPVTDAPGLGGTADRLDGFFDHLVTEHNLDLHLGEKIHDVLGAAIEFGMALMATEALGFGHRDALQADLLQRLLHLIEFEWLDDRFDFFHSVSSPGPSGNVAGSAALSIAGSVPRPKKDEKASIFGLVAGIRPAARALAVECLPRV